MENRADFVAITIEKKDGTAIIKEYENRIFELWERIFPCSSVTELFAALGSCFIDDNGIDAIGELKCVDDINFIKIDQSDIVWGEGADFTESDYDNVEYDEENGMLIGTNTFFFIIKNGNLVYVKDISESECSDDFGRKDQCAIDFNGKSVVLTGFEEDEAKLISKIENSGGIIRSSVSRKTDYLIYNPEYIPGYTVKLRKAMYLALKGAPIKIVVCTDISKMAFEDFRFPPEFETKTEIEIGTDAVIYLDGEMLVRYNGCEENVVVPNGIARIAGSAFYGQPFIKSLELPDSVRIIDAGAFPANLERLILPSYLESINLQYTSFPNLTSISTKYCNSEIYAIDNCLLKKSEEYYIEALYDYVTGQRVKVQWVNEETEKSNYELIKGCINSIIPDYVSRIGASAFSQCSGLKTLRLPKNLKIIDSQAFDKCNELEEMRVPEGVRIIKSHAFCWCRALKCIYLPASLMIMENHAFCGSENVTLYVKANSYAEKYAEKANLHYEYY